MTGQLPAYLKFLVAGLLSAPVFFSLTEKPQAFFGEGTTISYAITGYPKQGKPVHDKAVLIISKVKADGSHQLTEAILTYLTKDNKPGNKFRMRFACDSLNFYVYTANWCYERADVERDENNYYEGDSLIYPLNMKTGDSLSPGRSVHYYVADGHKQSAVVNYYERVVGLSDTIVTAFGKIVAYPVSMTVEYEVESKITGRGEKRELDSFKIVEWFAPAYGVVRTEYKETDFGSNTVLMEKIEMK